MKEPYENQSELKEFVETHELQNKHSIIHFNSLVSITTPNDKITNEPMEVMITFNNYGSYGEITLLNDGLDTGLYPTRFDAKWQNIEHQDKERLHISDTHPRIGGYKVNIVPLERLRD